ncbi:40S ribosomal protein s11 [Plakobranchus ocellatus]|uniref:Small ribosomal subunit protein uS17 n=1 Tax=Plakobranchus ocellatus TaxID=259542 RepID=A0AAV4CTG9_9GAST|nr:40S ribosomal protein s11 [Plakobranchus ocellatus]
MADHQTERAFQKQPTVFLNKKAILQGKSKKNLRYVRNVGLGFKTPREAIIGTYIDKKCPFTGNVNIRGRILTGRVLKMKMMRTIVIRREYLHYVKKYNRFEKKHKNLSVHLSPCFRGSRPTYKESNQKMVTTFDLVNTLNSGKQHIVGKFIVHLVRKFQHHQ